MPPAASIFLLLDQSSQASVAEFAQNVAARFEKIDTLVNNAGIYPEERKLSVDGIELALATNVIGNFQLTLALESQLSNAAPSRVISSRAGWPASSSSTTFSGSTDDSAASRPTRAQLAALF